MNEKKQLTLSSGVVLNIKQVPPMVLAKIYDTLPEEPKPPRKFIEDLGREEENPNDPGYISAMEKYQVNLANRITDVLILLGTSFVSAPKGMPEPIKGYKEWSAPLIAAGIPTPSVENELQVYGAWIKYVAAESSEDINQIIENVSRTSGVSEEDTAKAASQFRS